MKKLSLTLDDLKVDSFHTSGLRQMEGTVFGEQCTCETACTCPGCPSCDYTCAYTCEQTCANTCGHDTCAYQRNPPFGPWYQC